MQFMTLFRRRAELCCKADFRRRLEDEADLVRDLRQAGIIRQIWRRGDAPGACLLIEALSEEATRAILEMSPLIRSGMLEIDTVVPLKSYDGLDRAIPEETPGGDAGGLLASMRARWPAMRE